MVRAVTADRMVALLWDERRPEAGAKRPKAFRAAGLAAATPARVVVRGLDRRAPRAQLLGRLPRDAGASARTGPVQPRLPPAGGGRERRGDPVEGDGDPRHVQAGREVRQVEADEAVQ